MTETRTQLELDLIGWAIAKERQRRHWTQKNLADHACVSPHTVCNLEQGKATSLTTLTAVLGALNLQLTVVPAQHEHVWARVCLECGERQVGAVLEAVAEAV